MAKHSFRDNCSIDLFIPYYVLLTIDSIAMRPYLQPPIRPWVRPIGRWATSLARRASTDGSDPSTDGSSIDLGLFYDGSDRPMASNIYKTNIGILLFIKKTKYTSSHECIRCAQF